MAPMQVRASCRREGNPPVSTPADLQNGGLQIYNSPKAQYDFHQRGTSKNDDGVCGVEEGLPNQQEIGVDCDTKLGEEACPLVG